MGGGKVARYTSMQASLKATLDCARSFTTTDFLCGHVEAVCRDLESRDDLFQRNVGLRTDLFLRRGSGGGPVEAEGGSALL